MPSNNNNFWNDPTLAKAAATPNTFMLFGDGVTRPVWIGSPGQVSDQSLGMAFIAFDAVTSVVYEGESQVTDYPVEKGLNVTDLSRPKPRKVTIIGVVTDAPVDSVFGTGPNPGNINLTQTGASSPNTALGATDPGAVYNAAARPKAAYELLEFLRVRSVVFNVTTALESYANMVIERCTVNVTQQTGAALSVTVELKEIRIVSSQLVAPLATTYRNATKKKNKANTDAVAPPAQELSSAAYDLAVKAGVVKDVPASFQPAEDD